MAEKKELSPDERLERAKKAGVPVLYFNGYLNNLGVGDVLSVLERNGEPVAILNMSYTIAKSLSVSLGQLITYLEENAGRPMLTASEVEKLAAGTKAKKEH
jgi:hypothetical protein